MLRFREPCRQTSVGVKAVLCAAEIMPVAGSGAKHLAAAGRRAGPAPRELLLADVGQALAQFGDQRIAIGHDALQAVDRVAQERAGVAIAS